MGMKYELNWYIVGSFNQVTIDNIARGGKTITLTKDEPRVYPIGSELPIISKGRGCIGMGKVVSNTMTEASTELLIEVTTLFDENDVVGNHYYGYYMNRGQK